MEEAVDGVFGYGMGSADEIDSQTSNEVFSKD